MSETLTVDPYSLEQVSPVNPAHEAIAALQLSADPTIRAKQVANNTSADGILNAITGLHTNLAPDIPHTASGVARKIINSRSGEVISTLVNPEDRLPLFEHASKVITALGQTIQPGQEQIFLDRASNVLALSVVLAHTFEDGNGRTARTLAHAIRNGSEVTEANHEDFDTVSKNRPDHGFKINSYLPTNRGAELSPSQLLDVAGAINIPLSNQSEYQQQVAENFTSPY